MVAKGALMAGQQVNVNLTVSDDGGSLKQRNKEAKDLNDSLSKAAQLAQKAMSQPVGARSQATGEGTEYGRARGIAGTTGASARDFANQAQGLGGLVRLYATYAANVFAVSAAFRALSESMNTENMIRGLDQLGARSGVALGGLSKMFVEVTGGAISARDAMEATAKAMSGGMSQKQFLQLGEVARKASQSLGVSMPDAVNRLVRGTTKLEPELLDELGLFTKVGKATDDYALKIGKTADSLTDFEKRQAFLNAVILEGQTKFAAIDIPTNPYDKLLSSLKNVAQIILSVVNTALVPLVDLLSKSPTALMGVIGGLGAMILRQALPIFSSYREAMAKANKEMEAMATVKAEAAKKSLAIARAAREEEVKQERAAIADVYTAQVDAKTEALKKLSKQGISKKVQQIIDPLRDVKTITPEELGMLDKYGAKQTKIAAVYRELAQAIRLAQQAEIDFAAAQAQIDKKVNAPSPMFSRARVAEINLEKARRQAASATLLQQVGATAQETGAWAATKELAGGIKTEKLGILRGTLTAVSGAATIATTAISGLFTVLGNFLGYLSVGMAVFEILDSLFSKNSKEVDIFNQALDMAAESAKSAAAAAKLFGTTLKPEDIVASGNAVQNVAESLKNVTSALEEVNKKSSGWDRFVDDVKRSLSFGTVGLQANFAESLSANIESGLAALADPALKAEAQSKLSALLNVSDLSAKTTGAAINALDPSKVVDIGKKVGDIFEQVGAKAKKSGNDISSLKESFNELDRSFLELSNQLISKDPFSNFGRSLAKTGFELQKVFENPTSAAATLLDIMNDMSKLKLLSPDSQQLLLSNKDAMVQLGKQLDAVNKKILQAESELKDLKTEEDVYTAEGTLLMSADNGAAKRAQADLGKLKAEKEAIQGSMGTLTKELSKSAKDSIEYGFKLVTVAYERTVKENALKLQQGILEFLPKTPGTIQMASQLENQKISLQIEEINQTERLIKELELLRLTEERKRVEETAKLALAEKPSQAKMDQILAEKDKNLARITSREQALQSKDVSKAISTGQIEKTPETLAVLDRQRNAQLKITALLNEQKLNNIKAEINSLQAVNATRKQGLQTLLDETVAEKQRFQESDDYFNMSKTEQDALNSIYDTTIASLEKDIKLSEKLGEIQIATLIQRLAPTGKLNDLAQQSLNYAKESYNQESKNISVANQAKNLAQDRISLLNQNLELSKEVQLRAQTEVAIRNISNDVAKTQLEFEQQLLDRKYEMGKVTEQQYLSETTLLSYRKVEMEKTFAMEQAIETWRRQALELRDELLKAGDDTERESIKLKLEGIQAVLDAELAAADKKAAIARKEIDIRDKRTQLEKDLGKVFESVTDRMTDAFANFVTTGKLSFKDLASSIIADLTKIIIKAQILQYMQSTLGGDWAQESGSWLAKYFGFSLGQGPAMAPSGVPVSSLTSQLPMGPFAKGGAFEGGVQKFSKGGTFTNQIVASPTLFRFAKGAGMMGEAGPEAIMPLTRDNSGNLGVRSNTQPTQVEVVVNNYTQERAETRETQDSKGNRKIEVVIGDMAAGEINRNGSSAQRSIRGTFGLQPQLIRR